jgi:hypothetical protein
MSDFDRLKNALTQQERYDAAIALRQAYLPEYLADDLSDPGNVDMWIACALYGFIAEQARVEAKEAEFLSCRRRSSFRSHLVVMGVDFPAPAAAAVDLLLTLPDEADAPVEDIRLERYHPFRSPSTGEVYCLFDEGAVWPAGRKAVTVHAIHGELVHEGPLGTTDGTPNQRFYTFTDRLVHGPGQETIEVSIGEVSYRVVESFAFSGPTDNDVLMTRLDDGRMMFRTGDGRNGAIPPEGQELSIQAVHGGGPKGAAGAGTITELLAPILVNGSALPAQVTNPLPTSSATDGVPLAVMRQIAPVLARAQRRIVTPLDYVAFARSVPGVLDARAERVGVSAVRVYVASGTTGVAPQALLARVRQVLTPRMSDGDTLLVAPAEPVRLRIEMRYRPKPSVRAPVNVERAMRAAIADFFDLQKRSEAGQPLFGGPLKEWGEQDGSAFVSDLQGVLEGVEGVDSFETDWFSRIPQPVRARWTGDASIGDISVSDTTKDETITVYFLTPTTFTVTGTVSGFMGRGTLGVRFSEPRGRVALTVSPGSVPMVFGDSASFRTSPKVGSVLLSRSEVAVVGTVSVRPA